MPPQLPSRVPNYKQRLLWCLFHPHLFVPSAIFLITIWGTSSTISKSATTDSILNDQQPKTSTILSTYTEIATKTSTVSYDLLSTLTPKVTVSSPNIENSLTEFLKFKANSSIILINELLIGPYHSEVAANIIQWNSSFYNNVQEHVEFSQSLQRYNDSIYSNLLEQSSRINSTIDELSTAGFVVSTEEADDLTSKLLLNYTFLNNIFGNISTDLNNLQSLKNFSLPKISFPLLSANNSYDSFITNSNVSLLCTELQNNISNLFKIYGEPTLEKLNSKRDLVRLVTRSNHFENNLRSKCNKLTLIVIGTYTFSVFLFAYLENIRFRLESSLFNSVLSQQVENAELLISTTEDKFKIRTELHDKFKNTLYPLAFAARYPTIDAITTLEFMLIKKTANFYGRFSNHTESLRLRKCKMLLKSYNWWIMTSGIDMWVLIFTIMIVFGIMRSILGLEAEELVSLSKRSTEFLIDYNVKYLDGINAACLKFEGEIDTQLNITLSDMLWNSDNGTITIAQNGLNSKMTEVINSLPSALTELEVIPEWVPENTTFDVPIVRFTTGLANLIFNDTTSKDTKVMFNLSKLKKRANVTNAKDVNSIIMIVYRPIIYCLLFSVCFHHLFGLLVILI